jgi:redox-sensitive bicupin YhaK (pirin superfamily)
MQYRGIRKIVTGAPAVDGAGVRLVRIIGRADVKDFDPFLMLDAFDSENPDDYTKGFPWHPHRGIETVTYLVSGDIEHGDSLGNTGSIRDGGCQWMTAGSGIIHQEMPRAATRMLGLQLWLNLPAKDKMTEPKYRDLVAEKIPVIAGEGSRIAVLAGSCKGTAGAMRGDHVDATMLDIALEAGASCTIPLDPAHTAFIYSMDGSVSLDPTGEARFLERRRAVLLGEGEAVALTASPKSGARCVLFAGAPLREPVAWGGPIVMNTREELEHAFEEIDAGTFIRHG